jgi:hypothetical protein
MFYNEFLREATVAINEYVCLKCIDIKGKEEYRRLISEHTAKVSKNSKTAQQRLCYTYATNR